MSAAVASVQPQPAIPDAPPPTRRRRVAARLGHWAFVVIILAAVAAAVHYSVRETRQVSAKSDRPVAQARKGEFLVIVSCRGELIAGRSVLIAAPTKVPDLRIVWMAPQGSPVKEGEVVIRFDDSGAKRQLQEKEAALGQAQASLDHALAESRISQEKDNLEIAAARHAVEKARLDVSKADIVSALQAEEYKLDLALAQEKLRVAEATSRLNRTSGESKIASLKTTRDKNQVEVDLTKQRIERMTVKAPSDGVVTYLMNTSQGWMNARPFKVGDNVWPGSALAEIPDLKTLHMKARVEEMDRSRIEAGLPARILVDPFPEKLMPGKVARVSSLTEQNFEWPPSRNFRAFAMFDQVDERLRPGMNGRLDIVVDRLADAISVPAKAIFTRNGKPVVLLVTDAGLKPADVVVVARNPDEVAVKGVAAGATVALIDELAAEKKKS